MLTFTKSSDNPVYPVWERLSFAPGGQAALWITAAADPDERARSGSHLLHLASAELEQMQDLAKSLLSLPEDVDHSPDRGVVVEESLLVELGDSRRGFNLNYREDEVIPVAIAAAIQFKDELRQKLLQSPTAVVTLSARRAETANQPELVISCVNMGTEMVEFQMNPGGPEIRSRGPMGWQGIWQPDSGLTLGLVGKMGVMVDGLYAPAQLAQAEMGTLVLPLNATLPPWMGEEQLWVRLEGRIRLMGPGRAEEHFPETPFIVECPLAA